MVLRRLVVTAPFVASAFVLADADEHGWQRELFWSAFGWTVLLQFVTNGLVQWTRRLAWLLAGAVAFSIGPSAWVWGATYEIAGSVVVATCTAGAAAVFFMFGWAWASRTDPIIALAPDRPAVRPRRKSRVARSARAALVSRGR